MSSKKVHKYFKRNSAEWSLKGFLNESEEESFQQKIDLYLRGLENIVKYEKEGKRKEKAQLLLDRYRKAIESQNQRWGTGNQLVFLMLKSISRPSVELERDQQKVSRETSVNFYGNSQNNGDLITSNATKKRCITNISSAESSSATRMVLRKRDPISYEESSEESNWSDSNYIEKRRIKRRSVVKPHLNGPTELSNTTQETIEPVALTQKSSSDSSEKTTKNISIDLKSQTESISDSSDTKLENKNDEQLGASTLLYPVSALPDRKWCLSSGRNVEDVLYVYASKLEYEQPAHSFIVDTSDDDIKNLFTKEEWEEIMNANKKAVPTTTYNPEQHFNYQYVHLVFTYLLDEYESPKNRLMQPHTEGWYATNIWSILIDKAFLNIPNVELVRGRRWDIRSMAFFKIQLIVTSTGESRSQKRVKGHTIENIWGFFKTLETFEGHISSANNQENRDSRVTAFTTPIATAFNGLWGGSCLRLRKDDTRNIPLHLDDVMELIILITNIFQAKLRIKRCIEVLKNEPENETFLQEITQPLSRPTTPPRTVQLAKPTTTPEK
ncbi:1095_t:CDS:2, partial [Diversispora eburnea]